MGGIGNDAGIVVPAVLSAQTVRRFDPLPPTFGSGRSEAVKEGDIVLGGRVAGNVTDQEIMEHELGSSTD